MSNNYNLTLAKKNKNDEFYTRYEDIEKEIENYYNYDNNVFRNKTILLPCDDYLWSNFTKYFINNFERFGLEKLISTCISEQHIEVKNNEITLFTSCEDFEKIENLETRGKLFIKDKEGEIEDYLKGNGSFKSEEVCELRDSADIVITNPPFSLFRDFVAWIFEGNKKFTIMGSLNAVKYKKIFPLLKENKIWLGASIKGTVNFTLPDKLEKKDGNNLQSMGNIRWYTNLLHHRRNERLELKTMEENIKIMGRPFEKYNNYEAINVDKVKCIPSDYEGIMGVPITFLDKYCSKQFEIVGLTNNGEKNEDIRYNDNLQGRGLVKGKRLYARILIKHKRT